MGSCKGRQCSCSGDSSAKQQASKQAAPVSGKEGERARRCWWSRKSRGKVTRSKGSPEEKSGQGCTEDRELGTFWKSNTRARRPGFSQPPPSQLCAKTRRLVLLTCSCDVESQWPDTPGLSLPACWKGVCGRSYILRRRKGRESRKRKGSSRKRELAMLGFHDGSVPGCIADRSRISEPGMRADGKAASA